MEALLFEQIGRLLHRAEAAERGYGQLIDLMAKVVSGEIDRSRMLVNLTAKSVIFAPEGFRPEMPATINGVPVCVVAPEPPKPEESV